MQKSFAIIQNNKSMRKRRELPIKFASNNIKINMKRSNNCQEKKRITNNSYTHIVENQLNAKSFNEIPQQTHELATNRTSGTDQTAA